MKELIQKSAIRFGIILRKSLKRNSMKGITAAGVLHVIKKMGDVLAKEFPARADANDDEISDEIVIN